MAMFKPAEFERERERKRRKAEQEIRNEFWEDEKFELEAFVVKVEKNNGKQ